MSLTRGAIRSELHGTIAIGRSPSASSAARCSFRHASESPGTAHPAQPAEPGPKESAVDVAGLPLLLADPVQDGADGRGRRRARRSRAPRWRPSRPPRPRVWSDGAATRTSSASSALSIRAFTREEWTIPISGCIPWTIEDVDVLARLVGDGDDALHERLVVARGEERLRLAARHGRRDGEVGAEREERDRVVGLAVGDRLGEADADPLAVEGADDAEAGGRDADAAAGGGDEDGRAHGVFLSFRVQAPRAIRSASSAIISSSFVGTTRAWGLVAGRDPAVLRAAVRRVRGGVERQAEEPEPLDRHRPDRRRVLADAAREDERVEPAERDDERRRSPWRGRSRRGRGRASPARCRRRPPPRPSACRSRGPRRRGGPTSC